MSAIFECEIVICKSKASLSVRIVLLNLLSLSTPKIKEVPVRGLYVNENAIFASCLRCTCNSNSNFILTIVSMIAKFQFSFGLIIKYV